MELEKNFLYFKLHYWIKCPTHLIWVSFILIFCNLLVGFYCVLRIVLHHEGSEKRKASVDDLEELMIISLSLSLFGGCNLSPTWATTITHLVLSLLSVYWLSQSRMKSRWKPLLDWAPWRSHLLYHFLFENL